MPTTLEVLEALVISPSIRRVRFFAYELLHQDIEPAATVLLEFPPLTEDQPPRLRKYTVLDFDPRTGDLLIDFVVPTRQGTAAGPAADWATVAAPGYQLDLHLAPEPPPQLPAGAHEVVLAGDATALPAITALVAQLEPRQVADILIEVPSPGDVRAFASRAALNVEWLVPTPGDPRPLPRAVRKLPVESPGFWWVACEETSAQAILEHLTGDRGVPEELTSVNVFWKSEPPAAS